MRMADGLNQARAVRIAEIIADFRNLQSYISRVTVSPAADEYNLPGYVELRRCMSDAQALLNQPFQPLTGSVGDSERDKVELRRIITDAAVRRFKAQKIYMRTTSCLRWVNSRMAVTQASRGNRAVMGAPLQRIDQSLTTELNAISDQRVYQSLAATDNADGKWTAEDPSLQTLQSMAR